MRKTIPVLVSAALLLGSGSSARAEQIAFSSLPATSAELQLPDDDYLTAFGFVPAVTGWVDTLTVPVRTDAVSRLVFSLWSSEARTPGAPLGVFPAFLPSPESATASLRAPSPIFLTAGSLYFLVASARDFGVVYAGSAGLSGPIVWADATPELGSWRPHVWTITPAFRLSAHDVEPIPEPATLVLLGTGLGGLVLRRRMRPRLH